MPVLVLAVSVPARAAAPISSPEVEEAAGVAQSAAQNLVRGHAIVFEEAVDRTALIRAAVGAPNAALLTENQRQRLVAYVLRAFEATLSPAAQRGASVLPLGADSREGHVETGILLPNPHGVLKTEWILRKHGPDWRIADVRLVDIGESARDMAIRALGDPPLALVRDPRRAARRAAVPRIAGIAAVLLVAGIFARRMRGRERLVLLLAALGPLLIFAADGVLAVRESLKEPVELRIALVTPRQRAIALFNSALARNDLPAARRAAAEAATLGARPQPLAYGLGQLTARAERSAEAALLFRRALSPPDPAPGADLGLAQLAAARGDFAEARTDLSSYLSRTRADPATCLLKAAVEGRLRNFPEALATVEEAISLDPSNAQAYELGARLAAGAGDAALAVQRLRQEEAIRPLDRGRLAKDPAFAGIAEDPEWKAFLEAPAGAGGP
jgi:tetratricopeptide (TPR) repeat protein